MSTITACIFDLDGVIVDTAVYHYKAWKRLANELGFDFTEEDNEKLKGVSRTRSLELILQWGDITKTDAEKEELATRKNNWYVEMISKMTPDEVLPGAQGIFGSMHWCGYKNSFRFSKQKLGDDIGEDGDNTPLQCDNRRQQGKQTQTRP